MAQNKHLSKLIYTNDDSVPNRMAHPAIFYSLGSKKNQSYAHFCFTWRVTCPPFMYQRSVESFGNLAPLVWCGKRLAA
jgi:hypothetical protein